MPRTLPVAIALFAVLASVSAPAQTSGPTRTPTIDRSLEMVSGRSPKLSPDGRYVVYEQTRTN